MEFDDAIKCPKCGYTDTFDGFDVLGADDGNLFCNQCHLEFEVEKNTPGFLLPIDGSGQATIDFRKVSDN